MQTKIAIFIIVLTNLWLLIATRKDIRKWWETVLYILMWIALFLIMAAAILF